MKIVDVPPEKLPALAVAESVRALGYVQPFASAALLQLLSECETEHPRAVCTRYRRSGVQLDRQEKRVLCIRTNAAMSQQAASELTPKGCSNPIRAHELTVLRAVFTRQRWRSVMSRTVITEYPVILRYEGISRCAGCIRLESLGAIQFTQAELFPPPDCGNEACNLGFAVRVDFLAKL